MQWWMVSKVAWDLWERKKISRPSWEFNYYSAVQPKAKAVYTKCIILVPTKGKAFLKSFL
jgi:hypothetical protein